jgi:hypothetical protein
VNQIHIVAGRTDFLEILEEHWKKTGYTKKQGKDDEE